MSQKDFVTFLRVFLLQAINLFNQLLSLNLADHAAQEN